MRAQFPGNYARMFAVSILISQAAANASKFQDINSYRTERSTAELTQFALKVTVVLENAATMPERKAAEILKNRMEKRCPVHTTIVEDSAVSLTSQVSGGADLVIFLGTPQSSKLIAQAIQEGKLKLPTLPGMSQPHPESFGIAYQHVGDQPRVLVAGTDPRGVIYGAGSLLRSFEYSDHGIEFEWAGPLQDKPALPLRGGNPHGPGSRARQFGNLRPQTADEMRETMEDQMLLGTNIFGGNPDEIRGYGMMTMFGRTANEMDAGFPAAWRADNGRASKYVCPSIPEARAALLESFDKQFRELPDYDFFTTNSGDEGGCRCDKCKDWGGVYIRLVHDIADILHKYHPDTKVLATNQDLTNNGNQEIFDYLNSGDSSWLYAIRYGPGADEMQTYIRGAVNPRWFEYEGFGPLGNYLKYMHHELPRTTNIVLYSDITHWMQAQYAVPHPDIALAAVYDRRSWNARPKKLHEVGTEILHYAIGDMHYSEGMHDDFNKWFWYRMLWKPNLSAKDITNEYCTYWFGADAAKEMSTAIFFMEETLEKPLADSKTVAHIIELMHSAGAKIPPNLMKSDFRWRVFLQKALMDHYIQLTLLRGEELKRRVRDFLTESLKQEGEHTVNWANSALAVLQEPVETEKMKAIMAEALKLGEESNATIGYREPAPFIVGKLDLTETRWWANQLRAALDRKDDKKIRNAANMLLHYSEGGYYEDLGWPNEPQHLVHGETLWGFNAFSGPAKMSHYNFAFAYGEQGVTFEYDQLDRVAQYVVRISVGAHIDEEMPSMKGMKLVEGMKADDQVLSTGFPVPLGDVAFYEFDIPQAATADGKVRIELTPALKYIPITGCNEIWLMKKDKMPWTARP